MKQSIENIRLISVRSLNKVLHLSHFISVTHWHHFRCFDRDDLVYIKLTFRFKHDYDREFDSNTIMIKCEKKHIDMEQ